MRATLLALGCFLASAQVVAQTTDIHALARASARDLVERAAREERAGQPLQAESLYLRALGVDRGEAEAWLGAARLLGARGRRGEALRLLQAIPRRAIAAVEDRVSVARALHAAGDADGAIAMLREDERGPALRARVSLCAALGRFAEALAAARRWSELAAADESERREAIVTARALSQLVAEVDVVRHPSDGSALRRLLQRP